MVVPSQKVSNFVYPRCSPILVFALALFCLLPAFLALALPNDPSQLSRRSIEVEDSSDSLSSNTVVRRDTTNEDFQRTDLTTKAAIKKVKTLHKSSLSGAKYQFKIGDRAVQLLTLDQPDKFEEPEDNHLISGKTWKNPSWKKGPLTIKPLGNTRTIAAMRLGLNPEIFWASLSNTSSPSTAIAPVDLFQYGKAPKNAIVFLQNYRSSLRTILEDKAVSKHQLILLLVSLAEDGVGTMHRQKISHGELWPGSVIIHDESDGCSSAVGTLKAEWIGSDSMTDAAKSVLKSSPKSEPYYKSPEAVQNGKKYDTQSLDIWSLGVMLWVFLTGADQDKVVWLRDLVQEEDKDFIKVQEDCKEDKRKLRLLTAYEKKGKYTRSMTNFLMSVFRPEDTRPDIEEFIAGLKKTKDFTQAKRALKKEEPGLGSETGRIL